MAKSASGRSTTRVSNGLVALGSAAVLAVYTAGYLRTRPAAARLALAAERRPARPPAAAAADIRPASAPPTAAVAPAVPPPSGALRQPQTRTPPPASTSKHTSAQSARRSAGASRLPGTPGPSGATLDAVPDVPPAASQSVAAPRPEPILPVEPPPPPSLPAPATPPVTSYKDGTYLGWGSSRHGDIQASVVVENGRITSASIAQCLTRYSCSWIAPLPPQVVTRQSANVDYVSGATQSTNAFYDAVVDALAKAK